jgi:uncharacterized membrane protein
MKDQHRNGTIIVTCLFLVCSTQQILFFLDVSSAYLSRYKIKQSTKIHASYQLHYDIHTTAPLDTTDGVSVLCVVIVILLDDGEGAAAITWCHTGYFQLSGTIAMDDRNIAPPALT